MRVYQPLDTFEPGERAQLTAVPTETRGRLSLISAAERQEVYERTIDGRPYVCPAQNRMRTLLSILAFQRPLPDGVAQVFFTPKEMDEARVELERMQVQRPGVRPYLLQSAWHVPLNWFLAFEDPERRIEQTDEGLRVRYETRIALAARRLRKAHAVLKGGVHASIVGRVIELQQWVDSFDTDCVLELDYASVSALFEPDELADDHSAADAWSAVEALSQGDGMRAGLYYQRLNERWAPRRGREALN